MGGNLSALCCVPLTDMKLDCGPDFVTLVWTESRSQVDTSLFRLGNCFPTSFSPREAVFSVDVNSCNFRRLVSNASTCKLGVNYVLCSLVPFVSLIGYWEPAAVHQ